MNRRWFYCILFIVTCLKANGQRLRHANSHLEKFANLPELKSSSISICFRNVKTGKIVASLDEDRRLIPASTIKLVTTATVLSAAGENFRYHTQFSLRGIKKEDSTFEGNIEIRGSGDPSFGSGSFVATPRVEQIADTLSILLRNEGIAKINGGILIDHSFITDVPENPEWLYYDIANYYGAGVFGFNVLENTAFISLEKEDQGQACRITNIYPAEMSAHFRNNVLVSTSSSEEAGLYFLGTSLCETLMLNGTLGVKDKVNLIVKSAIPDPSGIYSQMLRSQLFTRGIRMEEINNYSSLSDSGRVILDHRSELLNTLIAYALKNSVNLYCEAFIHLIGAEWNGSTNRQNSLNRVKEYWYSKLGDNTGFKIVDGSGLSRKNLFTASEISQILYIIQEEGKPVGFERLLYDLSENGFVSSPLQKRKSLRGKWGGKTGSMEGVRALAGYIYREDKPRYTFSIIINNYHCSGKIINEKLASLIYELDRIL